MNNLAEILKRRAVETGDRTAFRFRADAGAAESAFSWRELDDLSRRVALLLASRKAAGERVLLLCPTGIDFIAGFMACLYAGAAAVPLYPPRSNRNLMRVRAVAKNAQAKFAVTTAPLLGRIRKFDEYGLFNDLDFLTTDQARGYRSEDFRENRIEISDPAFLQYTSGSTAAPKGVVVSHENLIDNLEAIRRAFGQDASSVIVSWLPLFHDMGLVGNVLQTIYTGSECVLLPPVAFLQKPLEWLKTISDCRATTSGGPNFGYELCSRTPMRGEETEKLDLSGWKTAFCGAEPVRAETLRAFAKKFAACGFSAKAFAPCYGLAEATLLVSANKGLQALSLERESLEKNKVAVAPAGSKKNYVTACGQIVSGLTVAVVAPQTGAVCAENEIGEIWLSGKSVARGYWNDDDATRKTFAARLGGGSEKKFLRTGDLGFLHGKKLYLTGRLKDLIIVRGRNHYPADLEFSAAAAAGGLAAASVAALARDEDAAEDVWIVAEAGRKADFRSLASAIVKRVAEEHDLRLGGVAFVRRGAIPKTSSGKTMRAACRRLLESEGAETLFVWDAKNFDRSPFAQAEDDSFEIVPDAAQALKNLIAERLAIKPADISERDSLIELGVDSLTATEICLQAERRYGLRIAAGDILQGETLAALARRAVPAIAAPVENRSALTDAVSHGQQALYFLQQLSPPNTAYNLNVAVRCEAGIDDAVLEKAIRRVVRPIEQLRSHFRRIGDRICRVEADVERFAMLGERFENLTDEELAAEIGRRADTPFDLERDLPLRAYLFENESRGRSEKILLLAAHHIVCDFWSLRLLAEAIGETYKLLKSGRDARGDGAAPEFSRFAALEREMLAGAEGERLWNFWREKLAGEIAQLDLPTDFPRPVRQSFKGAAHAFEIAAGLTGKLETVARAEGVTLYALLLAAYRVFLSRYTGQTDFLIGMPHANRAGLEAARTFGYFVNTLPVRVPLEARQTFSELAARTNREINLAASHAAFPLSLMVERLNPARDASRTPLFQTVFTWQQTAAGDQTWAALVLGEPEKEIRLGGFSCRAFPLPETAAQFDLALQAAKIGAAVKFKWQYDAALFKPAAVARRSAHFVNLLREIAENPRRRVAEYELLSAKEKHAVLKKWNATARRYDGGSLLLHELVERQVEKTPDNTALEFERESLTYAELNARANRLAHYLRKRGVGAETVVGVALRRSVEMVVALLGIVKAGAAYLPLDPSYPRDRFDYMLEDAGVRLLVTDEETARETGASEKVSTITLDSRSEIFRSESSENLPRAAGPDNAAYVIYTSGSTGRPKGAINSHANIVNRLLWMQEAFELDETDAVLQKTPFSFDVSVWEFFWTLMTGARLVVARPDGHTDSEYLLDTIEEKRITTLHFVPSMLNLFLQDVPAGRARRLRRVICSGEALAFELQQNFFETFEHVELHNLYGPTEAAIDVSRHVCRRGGELSRVPIGKPIANTALYVLDEKLNPVPVGVAGELYIGGANVGRGYLNRPALTAEKFIPDPYGEKSGARLYRTGDVARFLEDGAIEYLERRDGQIKLRGQRIELGEIQAVLLSHPRITDAAVTIVDDAKNHVALVAYYVSGETLGAGVLRDFLGAKLPRQMIPNFFVRLEKMPLSPNGKLDRRALPPPHAAGEVGQARYAAPQNETQMILASVWREVLGREKIGIDDNFFALGGDSIRSIQARAKARENGLDFELTELFRHQTVRALSTVARYFKDEDSIPARFALSDDELGKLPAGTVAVYPLTRLQSGLVFHEEHDRDYEIYVTSLRVSSAFDETAWRRAVRYVTERHEILRSSFEMSAFSEPIQIVRRQVEPHCEAIDLTARAEPERQAIFGEWLKNERTRGFDWTKAPLARFTAHLFGPEDFQLTLGEPVLDGWSVATLLGDLLTAYAAVRTTGELPTMPPVPPFSAYVDLEKQALASAAQRDFWRENLRDFGGCAIASTEAADAAANRTERLYVEIPPDVSRRIFDFAAASNAPLKSVLLAAHLVAVATLSGQRDVCTALLYNGRPEVANAERGVGLFLNAVPFRLDLGGLEFGEIARRAFAAETDLLPHRRFPLSEIRRIHRRRELFDTAFNYTHFHAYHALRAIEGMRVEDIYASDQTYFPLTAQLNLNHESETPDIRLAIDFRPAKIAAGRAREFAGCLSEILRSIGTRETRKTRAPESRGRSSGAPASFGAAGELRELADLISRIEQMPDEEARAWRRRLMNTGEKI